MLGAWEHSALAIRAPWPGRPCFLPSPSQRWPAAGLSQALCLQSRQSACNFAAVDAQWMRSHRSTCELWPACCARSQRRLGRAATSWRAGPCCHRAEAPRRACVPSTCTAPSPLPLAPCPRRRRARPTHSCTLPAVPHRQRTATPTAPRRPRPTSPCRRCRPRGPRRREMTRPRTPPCSGAAVRTRCRRRCGLKLRRCAAMMRALSRLRRSRRRGVAAPPTTTQRRPLPWPARRRRCRRTSGASRHG